MDLVGEEEGMYVSSGLLRNSRNHNTTEWLNYDLGVPSWYGTLKY